MATTYIVRKSMRNDLKDRPGYERFGNSKRPARGGGGRRFSRKPQRRGRVVNDAPFDLRKLVNKAKPKSEEAPYAPTHLFSDFKVDERLKENIVRKGYLSPTPIQDQSIPEILSGKDVVGLANTGTGKTAAFLIPLIDKVLKLKALGEEERVLIMVPTRELAIQIEQEFWGFARLLNINAVVCVGGTSIQPQMRVLRKSPSFVVGTPGRLKDLMERKELDLSTFGTVVLDEADRMLDMGFIDDMRFILSKMPKKRLLLCNDEQGY